VFQHGQLTRQGGVDPRAVTFAVLDLQTTGLHPKQGSRVCEVAVVRMRGDGVVLDEYATLVNPGVRIGNDEFHGITNADVRDAPAFQQVAGDLLAYLSDAVVVGHHLEFEEKFLVAEFGRLNVNLVRVPGLCSLVTSRVQLDRWGYKLDNVASLLTGEWPPALHSALGNARALAASLAKLISEAPRPLYWVGPPPMPLPMLPRTGAIVPRATALRKGGDGWLATLMARLPYMVHSPQPRAGALRDYRALLAHALADGRIVGDEASQLAILAARAGLTQNTARQVHEEFLTEARARAEADGVVTSAELRELQRAAKELAASHLISDLEEAAAANRATNRGPLKGWRLMPVGDSPQVAETVEYAVEHGAKVAVNITKTVRMLITDGASAEDPRIAKAHALGVDILTAEQARKFLEGEIAKTATSLFSDADGEQIADRLAVERAAAAVPARPEWHEFWRPRELTPAEYRKRFIEGGDDWDQAQSVTITVPAGVSHARSLKADDVKPKGGCAVVLLLGGAIAAGATELVRQFAG